MSNHETGPLAASPAAQQVVRSAAIALRSMGEPNSFARRFGFWDAQYEWRRIFSELLGMFLLVAAGALWWPARTGRPVPANGAPPGAGGEPGSQPPGEGRPA